MESQALQPYLQDILCDFSDIHDNSPSQSQTQTLSHTKTLSITSGMFNSCRIGNVTININVSKWTDTVIILPKLLLSLLLWISILTSCFKIYYWFYFFHQLKKEKTVQGHQQAQITLLVIYRGLEIMYAWKFHRRGKFVLQSVTGGIRNIWSAWQNSRIPSVTDCITNSIYPRFVIHLCWSFRKQRLMIYFSNCIYTEVGLVNTTPVTINYDTSEGILDFYVFMGLSPDKVKQQYSETIGRTMMPPYWSFGFQLCRWGYTNADDLRNITNGMRRVQLPYVNT